jgi:hypothetical protein
MQCAGDEVVGRWQNDVQDGLSVFRGADGFLREEQWSEGERMSSRPIGNADPLAISAGLDAERVLRKCSQDTSQFHLMHKAIASEHGLPTVSPRVAAPPPGSHTPAEILDMIAQRQGATAAEAASHGTPAVTVDTKPDVDVDALASELVDVE